MVGNGYLKLLDDDAESFVMLVMLSAKQARRIQWHHNRIDWQQHVEKLQHTNGFQKQYHLSEASFNCLVNLLRDHVSLDEMQLY